MNNIHKVSHCYCMSSELVNGVVWKATVLHMTQKVNKKIILLKANRVRGER